MSYDLTISVRVEGCDRYAAVAHPEYDTPTYNLGEMFRKAMDWDYSQGKVSEESGEYETCYYRCDEVVPKVEHGLHELRFNRKVYEKYNPENGWGDIDCAIRALQSLLDCIKEKAEYIPLECLYMSW